jgi:hypothetical protein
LNIIEYLFCESLFGKVLLIEKNDRKKCSKKSAAKKVQQKKCGRKIKAGKLQQKKSVVAKTWQEKCDRKSVAGKVMARKVRQENPSRKCAVENRSNRKLQEEKGMVFICVVLKL